MRIAPWYAKLKQSHFGLPPSSLHRQTWLAGSFTWTSIKTNLDTLPDVLSLHRCISTRIACVCSCPNLQLWSVFPYRAMQVLDLFFNFRFNVRLEVSIKLFSRPDWTSRPPTMLSLAVKFWILFKSQCTCCDSANQTTKRDELTSDWVQTLGVCIVAFFPHLKDDNP